MRTSLLTATAALAILILHAASGGVRAADPQAPLALVAVREFSVQGKLPAETPVDLGRELANSLAEELRDRGFEVQVIGQNGQAPRAARYLVLGEIDASAGSLAGRFSTFGIAGRAKLAASAKLLDNKSGGLVQKFQDSASSGNWKGEAGPIVACAKQVGEALGKEIAKKATSLASVAKGREPNSEPTPRRTPARSAVKEPSPGIAVSAIAKRVAPLLVGTWQSGSGTSLTFDDAGNVVEATGEDNRRKGRYEILDSEQIVLTFGAQPKGAHSGSRDPASRNSSYLVKYKLSGDDLTLIYLDAEVWKYKRQR